MKKKIKVSPLAEHIEDFSDLEYENDFQEENDVFSTDENDLKIQPIPIDHKVDNCLSAAAWFHEMKKRGMTEEEEKYVELMLIELAEFYFAALDTRDPSAKCREALESIRESIERSLSCTKS